MDEKQIELCAHALIAADYGGGISVDPELEADAEELIEKGWLRPAEGTEDEIGYAITDEGKHVLALAQAAGGLSPN